MCERERVIILYAKPFIDYRRLVCGRVCAWWWYVQPNYICSTITTSDGVMVVVVRCLFPGERNVERSVPGHTAADTAILSRKLTTCKRPINRVEHCRALRRYYFLPTLERTRAPTKEDKKKFFGYLIDVFFLFYVCVRARRKRIWKGNAYSKTVRNLSIFRPEFSFFFFFLTTTLAEIRKNE